MYVKIYSFIIDIEAAKTNAQVSFDITTVYSIFFLCPTT